VRRDTENQFAGAGWFLHGNMALLAIGEMGGFAAIFSGSLCGLR
jgi:hypothetical protein